MAKPIAVRLFAAAREKQRTVQLKSICCY